MLDIEKNIPKLKKMEKNELHMYNILRIISLFKKNFRMKTTLESICDDNETICHM